ncbi:MAG: hypothetical protein SFX19_07245 [Alphaproteobacteria bacterium]|nr:hypothetical protein [Alphaproteobacteria bacterium]
MTSEGFIVEFHQIGGSIKVTAFDPLTLTEATIVGSPGVSQKELAQLAVRKLLYVMNKEPKDS